MNCFLVLRSEFFLCIDVLSTSHILGYTRSPLRLANVAPVVFRKKTIQDVQINGMHLPFFHHVCVQQNIQLHFERTSVYTAAEDEKKVRYGKIEKYIAKYNTKF